MEDKNLRSQRLQIDEDDIRNEKSLEILLYWKQQTKKEILRMSNKIDITIEKGNIPNPAMKRAVSCQKLILEFIEDRIKLL
ncbi:MAG: hypothetical protein EOL88_02360 [Bacteroidia bacterium]|nr:hypothetical protein [Bacteroidia bacterium]